VHVFGLKVIVVEFQSVMQLAIKVQSFYLLSVQQEKLQPDLSKNIYCDVMMFNKSILCLVIAAIFTLDGNAKEMNTKNRRRKLSNTVRKQ